MNSLFFRNQELRHRLLKYLNANDPKPTESYILTIEICTCLVQNIQYGLGTISPEERRWFNREYYVDMALSGSEWEDLSVRYAELCAEIKYLDFKVEI